MTASPAYRLTLFYPDGRRVILTVLAVEAAMSGGAWARRSSLVMQQGRGAGRETLCELAFDDFREFAGTDAALESLRAIARGDLQTGVARADEAAQAHIGWRPLRTVLDRLPITAGEPPDVVPPNAEKLGHYPSIAAYLQSQLEDYVHPAGLWILDYLDMPLIRARFEAGGRFRYFIKDGSIYRSGR